LTRASAALFAPVPPTSIVATVVDIFYSYLILFDITLQFLL